MRGMAHEALSGEDCGKGIEAVTKENIAIADDCTKHPASLRSLPGTLILDSNLIQRNKKAAIPTE